ncbi:MAG TPA: EAL domain-containing protein [Gemmatimonadaceae bacterium]|nr:EAL domain-containing protein [Gemmatimonadaceae bacterium]
MRHRLLPEGAAAALTPAVRVEPGRAWTALGGTLAASLERSARVAASVLRVPGTLVALLGDDRRCFGGGRELPHWLAHDPGILVRSGLCERLVMLGEPLVLEDVRVHADAQIAALAGELGIGGFVGVRMTDEGGGPIGIYCALDDGPRQWTADEVAVLADLAASAATELALRRRLAERDRVERQLRHDARHDPLTGLPNRAFFMERLGHVVSRRRARDDHPLFAILFLDLDNFKVVNDSVGHHAGDELLIAVARRLEQCVRGGDMVCRLGGDEFALLLENVVDARDAACIASRVQEALSRPVNLSGYELFTSVSIGVALSSTPNERPEYLLRSADMAMYRAKNVGKARFEMFDPAMHAAALTRLQLETDLRRAVEYEAFELAYQPIVSLETGRMVSVEALLRWPHPDRGLVEPGDFVPVAEETGLIVVLGRWVLREACRQLVRWREAVGPAAEALTVSVNLSPRQFTQVDVAKEVAGALAETGLDAASLALEITESVIIERAGAAALALTQLKAMGVHVYMDDFGTGYSSLSYLHQIPLDAIKIDRAFIAPIDDEERMLHLVRTIVTLARNLGLQTVAEGVTTPMQLQRLREAGCDSAQGYLFARPMDAADVERVLRERGSWL